MDSKRPSESINNPFSLFQSTESEQKYTQEFLVQKLKEIEKEFIKLLKKTHGLETIFQLGLQRPNDDKKYEAKSLQSFECAKEYIKYRDILQRQFNVTAPALLEIYQQLCPPPTPAAKQSICAIS